MIDLALLKNMIDGGFVNVQKHPKYDLFIYNYTPKTQYERVWNAVTLMCRGLILDGAYNIVARPFEKFFNLGEQENQVLPNEPFSIFEKLDGSLGILYFVDNEGFMATRGSFTSEQSTKANAILRSKYAEILRCLDQTKTYLFEIIYPENRIVVNYGALEDVILTAIIDTQTGENLPLTDVGFPIVKEYKNITFTDDAFDKECKNKTCFLCTLKDLEEANREGFVIQYKSGLRYKVKFEDYMRIHRIVTQVSNINIWEYLAAKMPFDEMLDRVPDEFYDWVKATSEDLKAQFEAIAAECQADFKANAENFETRKEAAAYFLTCRYPSVLFKMLDGKPYDDVIWKLIRPSFQKPFSKLD
jgi:T4 RnlA family RNA ligase